MRAENSLFSRYIFLVRRASASWEGVSLIYSRPNPNSLVSWFGRCEKYIGRISSLSKNIMGKFASIPPSVNLCPVKSISLRRFE